MNKILSAKEFAKAVISGANALINAKNRIDALNVFPVPDGDTGTNMASTISAVISPLNTNECNTMSEVTDLIAHSMIYEARGNSGVILSQIFRGFAKNCEDLESLTINELLYAFEGAKDRAYKAVFKPVEGTILTVIREISENLTETFKDKEVTLVEFFDKTLQFARKSCDETPNKLKTLREVGVTDSGGEGLYTILWGMNEYFNGRPVEVSEQSYDISNFISDSEVYEGEFGYCTEVLVDLNYPNAFNKELFQEELTQQASSLVIVVDENLLKVHGHTTKPGDLLNFAQNFGEFIKIKSENMTLQANNSKANSQRLNELNPNKERKVCGIVSCNLGSGIIAKMKEYGADYVVESGQSQNPSAQDLITAFKEVNAENIFVLPNNSNVILVAQQAAQVYRDSNVIVIPTKTQIQGVTALINYNSQTDPDDNIEMMEESIKDVSTGEVTRAVRDTKLNGIEIQNGDFLAILNGKIIAAKKTYIEAAKYIIGKLAKKQVELISIYYGDEATNQDANELANFIESKYDVEVEIIEGNQPNYHFLIGAE
ncbi:DAK2 domain-containing protein [Mycoplasma corogypsi]|uniref:DAK2 domain-containing protein n=1 Tax=Mycoplasma corogypsi TaxID=2106 RepID=UPI003872F61F